jgi:hypothetical protein
VWAGKPLCHNSGFVGDGGAPAPLACCGGGGGGAGYYGGGGGSGESPDSDSGGGDGSSYYSNALFNLTVGQGGDNGTPGGTSDPFYIAGVGVGSTTEYAPGGSGEIVIAYAQPGAVPEPGIPALLAASGLGKAGLMALRHRRR